MFKINETIKIWTRNRDHFSIFFIARSDEICTAKLIFDTQSFIALFFCCCGHSNVKGNVCAIMAEWEQKIPTAKCKHNLQFLYPLNHTVAEPIFASEFLFSSECKQTADFLRIRKQTAALSKISKQIADSNKICKQTAGFYKISKQTADLNK